MEMIENVLIVFGESVLKTHRKNERYVIAAVIEPQAN